jgi:hypothetical protein
MAVAVKHNAFSENVAEKVHNLGADTLKVMLCNTAPTAANSIKSDLTEIAAGGGYTAGGLAATISTSAQTGGVYKLVVADVVFQALGGSIGPFRYAEMFNDTPSSPLKPLIAFWDYGSSITLQDGETFTVDFDQTNGVMQFS